MLTQEAAYKQIQDAKSMVEDDLQHKLDEFEEERERLIKLANTASTLERELEQVIISKVTQCVNSSIGDNYITSFAHHRKMTEAKTWLLFEFKK